ncbi:MAG: SAM-dependent methyltransferase [Planctomycetaceae bacterium]|nr:SAM-dependent methyltransferase [Planctomycetaceae bacterium]
MFLFALCQTGAEKVLKQELNCHGDFRLAFSRPGFVSFKMPEEFCSSENLIEDIAAIAAESVFARTISLSLGKVNGTEPLQLAKQVWEITAKSGYFFNRVNVCGRDTAVPGTNGFEPAITTEQKELQQVITENSPYPKFLGKNFFDSTAAAQTGETVLDVVQVESEQYFIGVKRIIKTTPLPARYSGGITPLVLPPHAVSRAYLKFEEGLRWSELPILRNDVCVDIGASPGGGSQALLARGASVLGIDPAEMSPVVLQNPNFTHLRGNANQIKRFMLRKAHWLIADMNVAPNYTLDVIEDIISYGKVHVSVGGMLFTLKLLQWELAAKIPSYIERIRSWGYGSVRIKQLAFNRQEVMAAVK